MRINWFFFEQNWIPFTQGCFVPSLVKISQVVLEKKMFFNFVNVFSLFLNYLPLEKGGALHLNKVEYPSPKDAMCQIWLKLAQWFWRRRFFYFINVFSLFRNYRNFEKGGDLHLNKLESPSSKDVVCQFGWNWPSGSREEDENVKSLQTDRRTDRQTDDVRQVIRKAHLSFQLRWAKNTNQNHVK